jgi:type VI secretion system protein ImpJ
MSNQTDHQGNKQAVYWHQGMFMQPQHFQLAERHEQFRLKPLLEGGLPHFWGAGALDISASAIANRSISVRAAQLVFDDGTYVEFPGNAVIAPRAFDPSWVSGEQPLTVYLGLKRLSEQEANVTLGTDQDAAGMLNTRYVSDANPPEVRDLYSEGPAAQVLTLTHVVRVFFEHEIDALGRYDLIPIAQLIRNGDTIELSAHFIGPCYALQGSPALMRLLTEIRDELSGRAHQLQELKSPNEMQKSDFDPMYMLYLLALRSLNRACPQLLHLCETPVIHPWTVYGTLRQLIGELSAFSERFDMFGEARDGSPGLPAYDHLALTRCFGKARALIAYLLGEITIGPEHLAVLTYEDGMWAGELPRAFFDRRNRFYLVVRSKQHEEQERQVPQALQAPLGSAPLVEALLRDARLATTDDMPGLIGHALPGLELIHLPVAPQGLPRRASSFYFRIEQVSELWDAVERDGRIALQWRDAPEDLRADVVILRR